MLKKKSILFVIIAIISIAVIIFFINRKGSNASLTPQEAIALINEEHFEISIDANSKTAVVDGKEVGLTELLALKDEELNEMIASGTLEQYLSSNLTGDIQAAEDSIVINNPYSTKMLMVQTSDRSALDSHENIVDVNKIVDDIYIVKFDSAQNTKAGYEELEKDSDISAVAKDHIITMMDSYDVSAAGISGDNYAWGVASTGLGHYKLKLEYAQNDEEIVVAVLDTGINSSHEIFKEKTTADRLIMNEKAHDYVNNDDDVTDDNGHGTAVAGIIMQSTPANVKVLPVKVLNDEGKGTTLAMMNAINAIGTDVDIINLSIGVKYSDMSENEKESWNTIFKSLYDSGILVVCAAGNEKGPVAFPAAADYTLAASAVNDQNEFATSFSNFGEEVDFALPGVNLIVPNYQGNNAYTTQSGTSFSCPFLAAAVANVEVEMLAEHSVVIMQNPDSDPDPDSGNDEYADDLAEVVQKLKDNAVDLGDTGKDNYYGYGSINFDTNMFLKPVIAKIEVPATASATWATSNNITVKAVSSSNMKYYALSTSDNTPTQWTLLPDETKALDYEIPVSENGLYYFWVEDVNHKSTKAMAIVLFADSDLPTITSLTKTSVTCNSITTTLATHDSTSGVAKIKWYCKKASDANYSCVSQSYGNEVDGDLSAMSVAHTFEGLDADTEYNIYAEVLDMAENTSTTDVLTIKTAAESGTITIVNHTNNQATVAIGSNENSGNFSAVATEGKIYVICDKACVVIAEDETNHTYTVVPVADSEGNRREYDFELGNMKFIVALKGDVNMNGTVNVADTSLINRSLVSTSHPAYQELTDLQKAIADINENTSVNVADTMLIIRSLLSATAEAYQALTW